MTSAEDVLRVIDLLASEGIDVWVDGGWAVDALLGEQTRLHNDLDLAVRLEDRERYDAAMSAAGFRLVRDDGPCNYVAADDNRCEVDVHFVDFDATHIDERGVEVYGGITYEVGSLTGTGTILGRRVACCAAEPLVRYHTGYVPDEDDYRDVVALCDRFGIAVPPPYDHWPRDA